MKLISSAFDDGAAIPRRFTCDGENLSPPLQWSGTPAGARSFVLLCDDPDAPAGTWHHWAAYDIPPTTTELADDAAQNTKMKQAVDDFRKVGYGGPCPPHGHGPHHYHFRLLALSTDHLRAKSNASCPDIEREARKYAIAEAILVGWYERYCRQNAGTRRQRTTALKQRQRGLVALSAWGHTRSLRSFRSAPGAAIPLKSAFDPQRRH
jgi:Raf kinase inhibitor-like YbhB/YbcL family protein